MEIAITMTIMMIVVVVEQIRGGSRGNFVGEMKKERGS